MKQRLTEAEAIARFWLRVDKSESCWFYCQRRYGWGDLRTCRNASMSVSICGESILANRLSYQIAYGPIPPGLVVRHRCGRGGCVNPDHLTIGTQKENMLDNVVRRELFIPHGELFTYEDAPLFACRWQ